MELKALKELAVKVEAGIEPEWGEVDDLMRNQWSRVVNAYNGSLDAADALHEAVLPDYDFNLAKWGCHVFPAKNDGEQYASTGINDNPARAWLLAIIRAKIAELEIS